MKNGEGQLIVAFLKGNWVRTHEEWKNLRIFQLIKYINSYLLLMANMIT